MVGEVFFAFFLSPGGRGVGEENIFNNSPPWRGAAFEAGRAPFISHPESSFFEGVRISSETTPVILRLRFLKP